MKLSGAEILLKVLSEQGVDTIFGYPGSSVLKVYDKLPEFPIRHILTAHEQGACFAAEGYARSSGKTGVVLTTSGPGATNLVTGIADAFMDSVPLVALTGNVPLLNLGHDCFQEVDIFGMTLPIVKHSYIVQSADELADVLREAFFISQNGRKGPVLVDIPTDIFEHTAEYTEAEPKKTAFRAPDISEIDKIAALLNSCEKPLIYAGGGVVSSDASAKVCALAEKISAKVAVSFMGIGAVPSDFKNYVGVLTDSNSLAAAALKECDLLICLGARFNNRIKLNKLLQKRKIPIAQIDIDRAEIDKNVTISRSAVCDISAALDILLPKLGGNDNPDWVADCGKTETAQDVRAVEILKTVAKYADPRTVVVTDVGLHQLWTALNYPFKTPRSFITSGGLGVMGFGLGAAIGAAFATEKPIVLITGDGSFNMNLNELATAVKHKLKIAVFVMNNSSLGMIRQVQQEQYGRRFSQSTLYLKTDYVELAKAFGADGLRIPADGKTDEIVKAALSSSTPVVVDCKIPINDIVS